MQDGEAYDSDLLPGLCTPPPDPDAFTELVRRRHMDLFRFILSRWGDQKECPDDIPCLADELTLDVFAVAWQCLVKGEFRKESTLKSWLFAIARNKAVDQIRKWQRDPKFESLDDAELHAGRDHVEEEMSNHSKLHRTSLEFEAAEFRVICEALKRRLADEHWWVLEQRVQMGYSYDEISELGLLRGITKSSSQWKSTYEQAVTKARASSLEMGIGRFLCCMAYFAEDRPGLSRRIERDVLCAPSAGLPHDPAHPHGAGGERAWVERLRTRIEDALGPYALVGAALVVQTATRLPYADEVIRYTANGEAQRRTKCYETDLLILDQDGDGSWTPRVVVEFKLGFASTDQALAYGSRAACHKQVHPYLRYGVAVGGWNGSALPPRLVRHGAQFDFIMVFDGEDLTEAEWSDFLGVLVAELEASRCLQALLADRTAKRRKFRLLHRPLVLR